MQLIVHFGTFKTGTTSIQQAFHGNQAAFLAQGVLYPRLPGGPGHHALVSLFRNTVPPSVLANFGNDLSRLAGAAREAWEVLKLQVEQQKPQKVVLSSELFLVPDSIDTFRRFRALLGELGAELSTCAYVRAPAPFYLSYMQQEAKISGRVLPPQAMQIRRSVEMVEEAFGEPMLLRTYEPDQLLGGDVVRDFAVQMVGCALPDELKAFPRANEALSAESMSISVSNRRISCAGLDHMPVPEHQVVLNLLRDLEKAVGGATRPRLRPEVTAAVTRASTDLLWLRDARGITFAGIDYAAIDGVMPDDIAARGRIEDICEMDPERRDELLMRLVGSGIEAQISLARLRRTLPVDRVLSARDRLRDLYRGVRPRRN